MKNSFSSQFWKSIVSSFFVVMMLILAIAIYFNDRPTLRSSLDSKKQKSFFDTAFVASKNQSPEANSRTRSNSRFTVEKNPQDPDEQIRKLSREVSLVNKSDQSAIKDPEYLGKICTLAELYANLDPVAGFAWIKNTPLSGDERSAIGAFAIQLSKTNPALLRKFLGELNKGDTKDRFLRAIVGSLAVENATEAWSEYNLNLKSQSANPEEMDSKVYVTLAGVNPVGFFQIAKQLDLSSGNDHPIKDFFFNSRFDDEKTAVSLLGKAGDEDSIVECVNAYRARLAIDKSMEFADAVAESNLPANFKDSQINQLLERSLASFPVECVSRVPYFSDPNLKSYWYKRIENVAKYQDSVVKEAVTMALRSK